MSMPYVPPGPHPPHIRWDTAQGLPINAKVYGAIGDGTNHFITSQDITDNPQWEDRYTTADTWDFVGIQEAIYSAYGTPGNLHSLGYAELNREVYLPAGDYRINRTLFLTAGIGVILSGAGRFSTSIYITVKDQPLLETNMCYAVIRDIYFGYGGGEAHTVPTALVEWNWGSPGPAAGLAQLSVYDCLFHGSNFDYTIGFRAARDNLQGDNLVFHNCFFASCFYAGFATGSAAFNALQMGFFHCNFQSCFGIGILIYGGNIGAYDCSFQNGHFSSTPQQTGFDIYLVSNSGGVCSVIEGCRSESSAFLHADSLHNVSVKGCSNIVSPTAWVPDTVYAEGVIVRARSASAFADGRPYICVTGGTSGATGAEPEWAGEDGLADNTVVWDVYNYNTLEFDHGTIENCSFPWGQVKIGTGGPCRIQNGIFSRDDWLWKGVPPIASTLEAASHYTILCDIQVTHGGSVNQGSPVPYALETYDAEADHVTAYVHYYLPPTMPLLWLRNGHRVAHRAARDVGLWPSRGHFADGTNEDLSTNVLGNIGAIGPRHAPETADTAGEDQIIQGGLGRGTGASGAIRFRVAAPGATGSVLNFPHATIDALRVTHERVKAGLAWQPLKLMESARDALTGLEPGDTIWNVTRSRLQVWNGFDWDDASPGTITWTPAVFAGDLQAWWAVDDAATLWQDSSLTTPATLDTDPIGGISDKSGNSRHLLQATAGARPQLKLDITAGRPVVRHNGTDEFLQTSTFSRPVPNTLICIFRATTGTVIAAANGFVGQLMAVGGGVQTYFGYGSAIGVNADVGTQPGCAVATYDGTASKLWVNGIRDSAGSPLTAGGSPTGITVGAIFDGSDFSALDFCEAFVVDRALTDLEIDHVGLYAQRWGTPEPVLLS